MNTENKGLIISHSKKTISKLLKELKNKDGKFIVPAIQRDYVMGSDTECIGSILDDILNCQENSKNMNFSTLILFRGGGNYTVYDGQQRVTTVFLLLAVISEVMGDNFDVSARFGYSDDTKSHVLTLLDSIGGGGLSDSDIVDTSTYSIVTAVKYLTARLNKFDKVKLNSIFTYICLNIEFNTVIKLNSQTDMEQYFMEVNEGLALTPIEIFKAELIDVLLTRYGDSKEIMGLIYSIENELQINHNRGSQLKGKKYLLLFYWINIYHKLRTGKDIVSVESVEVSDITNALRQSLKETEDIGGFSGRIQLEHDVPKRYLAYKLFDRITNTWEWGNCTSVYEFFKKSHYDDGYTESLLFKGNLGKAIYNSYVHITKVTLLNSNVMCNGFLQPIRTYSYLKDLTSIIFNNSSVLSNKSELLIKIEELLKKYTDGNGTANMVTDLLYESTRENVCTFEDLAARKVFNDTDFDTYTEHKFSKASESESVVSLLYKCKLPNYMSASTMVMYSTMGNSQNLGGYTVVPNIKAVMLGELDKLYGIGKFIELYTSDTLTAILLARGNYGNQYSFPEIIRRDSLCKLMCYGSTFKMTSTEIAYNLDLQSVITDRNLETDKAPYVEGVIIFAIFVGLASQIVSTNQSFDDNINYRLPLTPSHVGLVGDDKLSSDEPVNIVMRGYRLNRAVEIKKLMLEYRN